MANHKLIKSLLIITSTFLFLFLPLNGKTKATSIHNSNYQYNLAIHKGNRILKHRHRALYVNMTHRMHFHSQRDSHSCESADMLMALSIKHHAHHMSLHHYTTHKIGWFHHGNKYHEAVHKYSRNPYKHSATIYPSGLKKSAKRMGATAKIIDNASKSEIIKLLLARDPIVAEAGHNLEIYDRSKPHKPSDHVILLSGFLRNRKGNKYVQYVDPIYTRRKDAIKWGSFRQFWKSYNRPTVTGKRAIVVLK